MSSNTINQITVQAIQAYFGAGKSIYLKNIVAAGGVQLKSWFELGISRSLDKDGNFVTIEGKSEELNCFRPLRTKEGEPAWKNNIQDPRTLYKQGLKESEQNPTIASPSWQLLKENIKQNLYIPGNKVRLQRELR